MPDAGHSVPDHRRADLVKLPRQGRTSYEPDAPAREFRGEPVRHSLARRARISAISHAEVITVERPETQGRYGRRGRLDWRWGAIAFLWVQIQGPGDSSDRRVSVAAAEPKSNPSVRDRPLSPTPLAPATGPPLSILPDWLCPFRGPGPGVDQALDRRTADRQAQPAPTGMVLMAGWAGLRAPAIAVRFDPTWHPIHRGPWNCARSCDRHRHLKSAR